MTGLFNRDKDVADDLLKNQLAEAWSHYRHCETMRANYLKMFFTGYLAATGFIVTLFKPDERGNPISGSILFGVAVLLLVVFCFSVIFYILIIRLNMVLSHYAKIMEKTRLVFFGSAGQAADIWSYKDIGLHPKKAKFFSISGSIPYLLVFLCGCLVPAQLCVAFILWRYPYSQTWRPSLILLISALMAFSLRWLYKQGEKAIANSSS